MDKKTISFGLNATNKILAPKLSKYYHNNEMDLFQKNLTLAARIGFSVSIILVVPIFLFPKYILSLYGNNFSQFSDILIILSVGHLVNSFCGPVGLSMTMTGNEKIVAFCVFIALLTNIQSYSVYNQYYKYINTKNISLLLNSKSKLYIFFP